MSDFQHLFCIFGCNSFLCYHEKLLNDSYSSIVFIKRKISETNVMKAEKTIKNITEYSKINQLHIFILNESRLIELYKDISYWLMYEAYYHY